LLISAFIKLIDYLNQHHYNSKRFLLDEINKSDLNLKRQEDKIAIMMECQDTTVKL
jgi:hypothetical protein